MTLKLYRFPSIRLIRLYSKQGKDETNNALAERFSQILEQKLNESPAFKLDTDPKFKELKEKYDSEQLKNNEFSHKYQQQLGSLKNESVVNFNKHAKNIADTTVKGPWDGTESTLDSTLRMITDLKPKEIRMEFKPKKDIKTRLLKAKDDSLDYKINGSSTKETEDNFREMYKEKLLGPSMLLNSSSPNVTLGLISSIAESKINEKINRQNGRFDDPSMDAVRGKPLNRDHLINSNDTNYFMNQILNKQDVLPPWVENQQSISTEIKSFRNNLEKVWINCFLEKLRRGPFTKEAFSKKISPSEYNEMLNSSTISGEKPYLTEKVSQINIMIRNFNLQSPSPNFHKFKLNLDQELDSLYKKAVPLFFNNFEDNVKDVIKYSEVKANSKGSGSSLLGLFDDKNGSGGTVRKETVHIKPQEEVHIWNEIKNMFRN